MLYIVRLHYILVNARGFIFQTKLHVVYTIMQYVEWQIYEHNHDTTNIMYGN